MLDLVVSKQLGEFRLDVELDVPQFGVAALFGRSGAGKTSVIAAIAGLLTPDAGRVRVEDRTLFDSSAGVDVPPHRRRVGYVFQDARLFPHFTVRGNLLYGYRRVAAGERFISFDRIVHLLGLEALLERRPHKLSGGEKQRVAIGRALLAQPRILLMDEPLAALDAPRKREILPYIERLRDEIRLPIVYVSHALGEVLRLANHMAILDEGRVVASGTPESLTRRLDLEPLMGSTQAGALIDAEVIAHDAEFQMTLLRFAGGVLKIPELALPQGSRVRLQIHARDVALATERPRALSIQNILEGRVSQIDASQGPYAEVSVAVGESAIIARVTRESVHRLRLVPGTQVFALVKSVAMDADAWPVPVAGLHCATVETSAQSISQGKGNS